MRFASIAITFSLAAVAFCNPLRRETSGEAVEAVLATIAVAEKDAVKLKSAVDSFPLSGTNNNQLTALASISAASNQLSSDFKDKALWKILYSNTFRFSQENRRTIGEALNAKFRPLILQTEANLQNLQPAVKKLGCKNLDSVYSDVKVLHNAFGEALAEIAVGVADKNDGDVYSGPLMEAYTEIDTTLQVTTIKFDSAGCQ